MARDFARKVYRGKRWERARSVAMSRQVKMDDGRVCPPYMCEMCFQRSIMKTAEIVHHKVHLSRDNIDDPEICYGLDNLMRVCRDCHAEVHYPDDYRPRVAFDSDGNVVPL